MDVRTLGSTGLTVSRIGLGMAALGRPGYINLGHATDLHGGIAPAAMEAHALAVLDAAWAAGIRYVDAARSYGRAEAFLASWLQARQVAPETIVVGSKWGYTYTAGWQTQADKHEIKDHSLTNFQRQIEESRTLLGPYLRLYQIHSATLDTGVLDNRAVLEELARWRDDGLHIGLTVTGPRQADTLRHALKLTIGNRPLFSCVQATWNLLEPSAGPALQEAKAAGMGVIVKEVLANGRLTARNDTPGFAPKHQRLMEIASRRQVAVDAVALAAVLAQPWVDVVLSGAATVPQLLSNLQALQMTEHFSADELCESLAESPEAYWQTRAQLPWN